MNQKNIQNKVISGIGWSSFSSIISYLLIFSRIFILVRFLSPDDFGIMALSLMLLAVMKQFSHVGLEQAVIQEENISEQTINTVWTVSIIRGVIFFALINIFTPFYANYFNESELVSILTILSFSAIFNGLKNSFGTQALCKYAQKACGGITGEGQQILFSVDAENVDHVPFVKVPTPIVIPGNSKPDFDKIIPEYQFVECPSGCSYEGKCLPVGTKIKENGDSLFCNWNGEMDNQLTVGEVCQNDYECGSNSCMSGKCLDLEKKLEEQQNLLNRILHWLENFFN